MSERQANNCEHAKHVRCRCRCGGAAHGAARGGKWFSDRSFFEGLPAADPHRIPTEEERRASANARALKRRREDASIKADAQAAFDFEMREAGARL